MNDTTNHMSDEQVVLVDTGDRAIGHMEKLAAHRSGLLHRAFSIFVFDGEGRLLLQRRALGKYHSPGLWSNTCCGHPRPGEDLVAAAQRRLMEEMGLQCDLHYAFSFVYQADLGQGLSEHELDHVFVASTANTPHPDADEVAEWRPIHRGALEQELAATTADFTAWFPLCVARAWDHHEASHHNA